jgi:hypothetical protein
MRFWIFALPFLLGGWYADQRTQFDACSANAQSDDAIQHCMIEHGYRRDFDGAQCKEKLAPSRSALCYEPRKTLDSLFFKFEMLLHDKDHR